MFSLPGVHTEWRFLSVWKFCLNLKEKLVPHKGCLVAGARDSLDRQVLFRWHAPDENNTRLRVYTCPVLVERQVLPSKTRRGFALTNEEITH